MITFPYQKVKFLLNLNNNNMWFKKIISSPYNVSYNKWLNGTMQCRIISYEGHKCIIELTNGSRHSVFCSQLQDSPKVDKKKFIQDLLCPHCGYLNYRGETICYDCEKEIENDD